MARGRAGLSREKILDAGIALADERGLPALSMRRLGAELGVEAMTLYHYVPNKDALLDGMVERVLDLALADVEPEAEPDAEPGDVPWPRWVRAFGAAMRAALLAHPGVLTLVGTHPVSSPGSLRTLERALGLLTGQGVPLGRALDLINAVAAFVVGHTLAEAGRTPGHEGSEPVLDAAALDPAEFPLLRTAVTTGAGLDFGSRFEAVLDLLITGYERV